MAILTTLTTAAGAAAGEKAIEKIVDDIYDTIKVVAGGKIAEWRANARIGELFTQIHNVRIVKTLWQLDKPVDLLTFYCDSHVRIRTDKNIIRKRIRDVSDFGPRRNLVVRGIAGQGKSTFLRYLCSRELELGNAIPVFVELRRISQKDTILTHIGRFLEVLGFEMSEKLFSELCHKGKLIFFLDGFDEVHDGQRADFVNELEHLANLSPKCQFIMTTRPGTGIESLAKFEVVVLDNLRESEYQSVIRKLSESESFAEDLISQIARHPGNFNTLLCTPLMVTLLVVTYKSYTTLPEQLADFYEGLFSVLLRRHDGNKPGFSRPRRCKLNDTQYRRIFDALCFETKKIGGAIHTFSQLYDLSVTVLSKLNITEDADAYLDDIIRVTCLILKEGDECRFIHKSVQEYYAASFIRNKPDSIVKKFYAKCLARIHGHSWQQELQFLSEIDPYRYRKYYLIPLSCKWLNATKGEIPRVVPQPTQGIIINLIGQVVFGFSHKGNTQMCYWGKSVMEDSYLDKIVKTSYGVHFETVVKKKLKVSPISNLPQELQKMGRFDSTMSWYTAEDMIRGGVAPAEWTKIAGEFLEYAFKTATDAMRYLEEQEEWDLPVAQMISRSDRSMDRDAE